MLNEELKELGLTEGESKVYESLLVLGPSTVGPIVKKSGVAYSNVYDILDRLTQKGLVSYILHEKTKHFQASEPKRIQDYLEKQEAEIKKNKSAFEKLLPKLESLKEQTIEKQEAEIFLGKKGLKSAYEKMFYDATKKDEALYFYIYEEKYKEESDLFYQSITHISKKPTLRGLTNKEYQTSWFAKKAKFLNIKFVDFPIPGNIDIFKDMVLMVSWHPTITAILIHSNSIAENLRDYFNQVWKIAKK